MTTLRMSVREVENGFVGTFENRSKEMGDEYVALDLTSLRTIMVHQFSDRLTAVTKQWEGDENG